MENNLSQGLAQKQTQQLHAGQLQSLDMLSAPALELEKKLATELAANPLLEIVSDSREDLIGDPLAAASAASNEMDSSEYEGDAESLPMPVQENSDWDYSSFDDVSMGSGGSDKLVIQQRRDHLFDSLTAVGSLEDMLLEQLNFADPAAPQRRIVRTLISSLDERGFLTTHPADIAMILEVDITEVESALRLLQSFDPPGIGARDVRELLMLQLKRNDYPDERIYTLLEQYSDELSRNQLPQIARSMKISMEQLQHYLRDLRKLNSTPVQGMNFSAPVQAVIPEMSVEVVDDKIIVSGHEGAFPRLGIVKRYLQMLEDPNTPEDTRKYLREKLSAAENLIKSLDLREDTLRRLTDLIVQHQEDFFRYGIDKLQPMTMSEAAALLDLHESTVSRAAKDKYIDTPQGVFEYKFFFSSGYAAAGGEDLSSHAVKEKIRELIGNEDKRKPLSDAAISEILNGEGINVARRTVAKYRESMNILPTNLRRQH